VQRIRRQPFLDKNLSNRKPMRQREIKEGTQRLSANLLMQDVVRNYVQSGRAVKILSHSIAFESRVTWRYLLSLCVVGITIQGQEN
jgi:hypothetical protein